MLEHDDVVDILTLVAASDGRPTPTEHDVTLWSAVLAQGNVTSKADALAAIVNHLATSSTWIKPVHVIDGVRKIRHARLEAGPELAELMADVDPSMPGRQYAEMYRSRIKVIADGGTIHDIRAITASAS